MIDNYISSCAGYCVITYFLGIGDRHLENLMIRKNGKFLHIDFGFILGKDPKPYPPPLKLCKEMVDGLGGKTNDNYNKFRRKCVEAYIYLRKYAKLIVNLFHLMLDSGIKDLS
jgi:phosphatidylinositol 3-kinase